MITTTLFSPKLSWIDVIVVDTFAMEKTKNKCNINSPYNIKKMTTQHIKIF